MLRTTAFFTCFAVFSSILISCVEGSEIKLISPVGAAARSIVPGWGQFYTQDKLAGSIIFLSIGILGGGAVRADALYRDIYNNKYRPAALVDSSAADAHFDKANQYYKLSRFFLYTAAGIWAYSALDAYADAHVCNARQQLKMLDVDDGRLQQLKLTSGSDEVTPNSSLRSQASVMFVLAEARKINTRCSNPVSGRLFSSKSCVRGD